MTACPPTTRNLISCFAKTANRSLKCEWLSTMGSARMCFQNHLPSRFEDRRRTLPLRVGDVELAACPVHRNHAGHEEALLVLVSPSHRYIFIIEAADETSRLRSTIMLSMAIRILVLTLLLTAMLFPEGKMFQPRFI